MTERPSDLLILALQPGDTLIVHLPKLPDAAYVEDVKAAIRRQLSFDVPIIIVGPGVTFEVARPVSEPPAVEPATCEHGRTAAHTTDCYCMCEHDCPGPV